MSKRQTALTLARIAGYHEDTASFTRLIIESRVARPAMNEAFLNGRQAKAGGMKCNCHECKKGNSPEPLHPYVAKTIKERGSWK
jgi:hypothetical protein